MNAQEIEAIAEAAADKAVTKCMFNLGLDMSDNDAILKARDDMAHIRKQREACESVKRHGMKTAITAAGTVAVGILSYVVLLLRGGN